MNEQNNEQILVTETEATADEQLIVEVPIALRAGYCTCPCGTREELDAV